jgi:hypothetical protein
MDVSLGDVLVLRSNGVFGLERSGGNPLPGQRHVVADKGDGPGAQQNVPVNPLEGHLAPVVDPRFAQQVEWPKARERKLARYRLETIIEIEHAEGHEEKAGLVIMPGILIDDGELPFREVEFPAQMVGHDRARRAGAQNDQLLHTDLRIIEKFSPEKLDEMPHPLVRHGVEDPLLIPPPGDQPAQGEHLQLLRDVGDPAADHLGDVVDAELAPAEEAHNAEARLVRDEMKQAEDPAAHRLVPLELRSDLSGFSV